MQADDRIPAGRVGRGEILQETRHLKPAPRRDVLAAGEDGRQACLGCRVVVLLGAGQRHNETARDVVGEALHVVDLSREQEFPDVAEDTVRLDVPGPVLQAVDRSRHTTGEEALDDLDELDHGVAHVPVERGIEAVRLVHEHAGSNQQVAETGARADAAVPVMRRVGRGEETRMLPLACEKNSLVRHEDVVEEHYARRLPVLAREHGAVLTRSARRASHDRHARGVQRDRAADCEVGVLAPMFRHGMTRKPWT